MLKFARRRARSSEREPVRCNSRVFITSPVSQGGSSSRPRASSAERVGGEMSIPCTTSMEAPATPVRVESRAAVAAPIKLVFQSDRENEPATSTRVTGERANRLSGLFSVRKEASSNRTATFAPMTSTVSSLTRGLDQVRLDDSDICDNPPVNSSATPIQSLPPVLPRKPKLDNFLALAGQTTNVAAGVAGIAGQMWKVELLDTSAESGYGTDSSDNNSLRSQESLGSVGETGSPPPLPRRKPRTTRRVQFDSYVLLIQALKDRDLKGILTTIFNVSSEALCTEDVIYHFHTAILRQDYEVTELLVRGGCEVNTFDHRGWSALHCACSLARLDMIKLLLQNGAAVLARTHHSSQTAAQLLPPDRPGYGQCLAYLRCMEECLGTVNNRLVLAAASYRATRVDEINITRGDRLFVQRRGDPNNQMWWWVRNNRGDEGYVLRDLLALNSRHS